MPAPSLFVMARNGSRTRMKWAAAAVAAGSVCVGALWAAALAAPPSSRTTLWSAQIGTDRPDVGAGAAVSTSGLTCIYGQTEGDFDTPGPADTDVFVACYDKSGTFKWVRQIGTEGTEQAANQFAVAPNGDVYIAGTTDGEFPGEFHDGGQDVFVAKFSRKGVLRWVKQFGGRYDDQAWGLTRARSGDLYLAVETTSDDFPAGSLTDNEFVGKMDSVLVKLSRDAELKWARQFGTTEDDWAWGVHVSRGGDVYIAGSTFADIDGAGPEQFHSSNSTKADGFLLRFNRNGERIWSRQFGGPDNDQFYGVGSDSFGDVYVAGFTEGALGTTGLLSNAGGTDGVVMKWSRDGEQRWVHQHGSAGSEHEWGLFVDKKDRIFVGGYTTGALAGYQNLGSTDAYILRLDVTGNSAAHRQFGTAGTDSTEAYGVPIAVSSWGNVVISGTTDSAIWGQANAGYTDAFITQLAGF